MNNNKFEKLIATLKSSRMDEQEKMQMLKNIRFAMAEEEVVAPRAKFSWNFFASRSAVAAFGLVVIVAGSVGVSSAAAHALPGDFLYPVKTQVNEKLKTVLATTPQAKAKVETEITVERLKEAETLAQQGELDDQKTAALNQDLAEHSQKAQQNIAQVRTEISAEAAQEMDDQLDESLHSHAAILGRLSGENDQNDDQPATQDAQDQQQHDRVKQRIKPAGQPIIQQLQERAEHGHHRGDNGGNNSEDHGGDNGSGGQQD